MLLNVAYKISAKVLQLRLQIILMEVVDADLTAFMPLCYILDNVLLVQETLDWAKCSNQTVVFLKQSFAKAYDKVGWDFMFLALEKLGMALEFIDLARLLFKNAEAAVCLNGSITGSFRIKRGVRQGCPLSTSSYLLWSQDLPPNFKLRSKDIWINCKARKESSFLWSLWHQALVVNSWRMKIIDQSFQVDCPSYDPTTLQTTTHQFWNCLEARTAREFASTILHRLRTLPHINGVYKALSMEQCLFNRRLPRNLRKFTYFKVLNKGDYAMVHPDQAKRPSLQQQ